MSDATADAVAWLRAARELWVELDDPPRRAVRMVLPGWQDRARMAGMPPLEFLQALMARVDQWRGFTGADAGLGPEPLPFSAELWELLLDTREAWIVRVVDAYSAATLERAAKAEAAAGN
jgi:hypothetical protein